MVSISKTEKNIGVLTPVVEVPDIIEAKLAKRKEVGNEYQGNQTSMNTPNSAGMKRIESNEETECASMT